MHFNKDIIENKDVLKFSSVENLKGFKVRWTLDVKSFHETIRNLHDRSVFLKQKVTSSEFSFQPRPP